MRTILVPIAALLLSDALLLIGHGLLLTLLPIAAVSAGFSDPEIAFTGSAYFLGFVFGCFVAPYVVRRVGHIRSFAVLATTYSAVVLLFPIIPGLLWWLLFRFLLGALISGLYMIIESWLNERSSNENRSTVLSIYTTLNLLMIIVGQQMFNLASGNSFLLFAIGAILVSIAILPVSLTLSLAPAPLRNVTIDLPKIWYQSRIAVIGVTIFGLVTGAFWSLGPVYGKAVGYDNAEIAMFMSATVLGGAVFQLPVGRLSDHFDRRMVVFFLTLIGAITSLIVAALPVFLPELNKMVMIFFAFIWGGAVMTLYAILVAHANDRATPDDFVTIGSGMLLILGICSAIGAPLASLAMKALGPQGFYLFIAVCLFVLAIATAVRRKHHALSPVEVSEPFRVVTDMVTPTAYEMDPRTHTPEAAQQH
ncbi:MAG: MFS transporter [Halioglobus sp.]